MTLFGKIVRNEHQHSVLVLAGIVTVLTVVLWFLLSPNRISSTAGQNVTQVFFADRISASHRLVIDRFNRLHRGKIEVVPVDLPFDKFSTNERKELLARSLRGESDKLDLFAVDLIWVQRFAKWAEPLNSRFGPPDLQKIIPEALRSCFSDTFLVSMPLYIDVGMMYYRRDLIERLPDGRDVEQRLQQSISWPEFLNLRTRLGYQRKPFFVFQADDYEGLVCNYLESVLAQDPSFLDSGRIDLGKPAARSALERLVECVHGNRISPIEVTDFDEKRSYTYMLDHDAVFVRGWPNFVETFRKTYSDTAKLAHIGIAALPHEAGGKPTSVFGGWNLMLSKYSSRKAEAVEFIRFVQTKEAQQVLYETDGFLPVTEEVYRDSVYMREHPDLSYYHTLLQRGFHRPPMNDYTRISDILSYFVWKALKRELTVPAALDRASEMINSNKVLIK